MAGLSIYDNIRQIPLTVDAFLETRPAINNISLGIFARMRATPEAFKNYKVFVVSDEGRVTGYAHHVPPYPLILADCDAATATYLARALRDRHETIPAVHGLCAVVTAFLEGWPELVAIEQGRETQGLYRLDQVIQPPKTGAVFGLAGLDDLPLLVQWHKAFSQETGDFMLADNVLQDLLRSRIEGRDLFLLRMGPRPVSMASVTRKIKDGHVISFIYTPKEDRGHGYAAELTAAVSAFCLANGNRFCCLFTQMHNPTSNKIYQKVGYQWVDEFLMVRFKE